MAKSGNVCCYCTNQNTGAKKNTATVHPGLYSLYVKYCSFQAAANSSTGFLFD